MRVALLALVASTALGSCSVKEESSVGKAERLAALKAITERCGLPETMFQLEGVDELHVLPPADAKYENVDCAFRELQKANMPLKMGFVGNEAYEPEKK